MSSTQPFRFLPQKTLAGGTRIGSTYLATAASCWQEWFDLYLRPYEGARDGRDNGNSNSGSCNNSDERLPGTQAFIGIKPIYTPHFLLTGNTLHEGLEALYLSGCRDGEDTGEWDLEAALAAADKHHIEHLSRYEQHSRAEEALAVVHWVLENYMETVGPGGSDPDYPKMKVLHDTEGQPLVEREFTVQTGYSDYYFTTKPDLLVELDGKLFSLDHKSNAARIDWVMDRLNSITMDPQFVGEFAALTELFPDVKISGAMINLLCKKKPSNKEIQAIMRRSTSFNEFDLLCYKDEVRDLLEQIDERVDKFNGLLDSGWPLEGAASKCFPRHGTRTGRCNAFAGCVFKDLCEHKDMTSSYLSRFEPRTVEETVVSQGATQ